MRPVKQTPAHHTINLELVCSNSLRGNALTNGVGVLKEEMKRLNSIIIEAADKARVPAGGALAVDRHVFRLCAEIAEIMKISQLLMKKLMPFQMDTPIITQQDHTAETLAQEIVDITGKDQLYFYDATAQLLKNLLIWIKFT